jgi:hypothetical protein
MPFWYHPSHIHLFLAGEICLKRRRPTALTTSASARIYNHQPKISLILEYSIPSARFPQAHVFVGILFSVALFSQAAFALASAIKAGHGIATHTALERRLLSARALCLGCADACSVVAAAASHLDNSKMELLVVVEKLNVGRQAARRR